MEECPTQHSPFPSLFDKRLIHISDALALVPYLPHHVPRYHQWMSNHEILAQTASEPLTIEEEYKMQISWANDPDKRTFIIIPREPLHRKILELYSNHIDDTTQMIVYDNEYDITPSLVLDRRGDKSALKLCSFCKQDRLVTCINPSSSSSPVYCCTICESYAAIGDIGATVAIGDVNLFLHDYIQEEGISDDGDDHNSEDGGVVSTTTEEHGPTTAEVEIMIANPEQRKRGYGTNALQLICQYSVEFLSIERIIAKISNDNLPSLTTFKRLGFHVYAEVECFDEVHLKYKPLMASNYPFFR